MLLCRMRPVSCRVVGNPDVVLSNSALGFDADVVPTNHFTGVLPLYGCALASVSASVGTASGVISVFWKTAIFHSPVGLFSATNVGLAWICCSWPFRYQVRLARINTT